MKKHILLASAATSILVILGGVTYGLTRPTTDNTAPVKKDVAVTTTPAPQQPATDATQTTATAAPTATAPTDPTPTDSTPAPAPAPTPAENKTKIMGVITDYATAHLGAKSDSQLSGQLNSFDAYFNINFGGYSDYDALYNSEAMQAYLSGQEMWVSFLKLGPQSNVNIYGY